MVQRAGGVQVQMDVREKIDYMIQCLQVAKAEYEYAKLIEADEEYYLIHRSPNKALIVDNLRNVARIGFQLANEVK